MTKLFVILLAACWLANTPAGIEIKIAKENPNAIITSSARVFRREMFLTALFNIPNYCTFFFLEWASKVEPMRVIFDLLFSSFL